MRKIIILLVFLFNFGVAKAADLNAISLLAGNEFALFAEDMAAVMSYRGVTPPAPLGTIGFDVGLVVTGTKIQNNTILNTAMSGNAPDTFLMPKLTAHKGLPFGIDVGGMLAKAGNVTLAGLEARYAIMKGGVTLPAIGIRGAYSKLTGVDELEFDSKSLDISVSKGILNITPYAGIGRIMSTSTGAGAAAGLGSVDADMTRTYLGVNFKLLILNTTLEADKTGDATSFSLKAGLRF